MRISFSLLEMDVDFLAIMNNEYWFTHRLAQKKILVLLKYNRNYE